MDLDEYSPGFSESEMIIVKYYKIMKMLYVYHLRSAIKIRVVNCQVFIMLHVSGII